MVPIAKIYIIFEKFTLLVESLILINYLNIQSTINKTIYWNIKYTEFTQEHISIFMIEILICIMFVEL